MEAIYFILLGMNTFAHYGYLLHNRISNEIQTPSDAQRMQKWQQGFKQGCFPQPIPVHRIRNIPGKPEYAVTGGLPVAPPLTGSMESEAP